MEEIKCIFCQIESDQIVIQENGYNGKKCPQCGLIYISPRPSLNEIIDLYGHDNAAISAADHISAAFVKRLYAKHNLGVIRKYLKQGALLEIGSGAGYFLDEARQAGFEPHGIEFNPIQAEFIRTVWHLPCEQTSLSPGIFAGKQFDIIYHCDVTSHFFDPVQEFKNMYSVLKEDGFLIFETGNLGEVKVSDLKYVKYFQYPDHLFFYNPENLKTLLEKTGFKVVNIHRYSIFPQLYYQDKIAALKRKLTSKQKNNIQQAATSINQQALPAPTTGVATLPKGVETEAGSLVFAQATARPSGITAHLKNLKHYLIYLLRYRIGAILPKQDLPQTVIIVAQKVRA